MTFDHYNNQQSLFKISLPWLLFILYSIYFYVQLFPVDACYDFLQVYFNTKHLYTDWHPFWMKVKLNYFANILFSDNLAEQMVQPVGGYFGLLWLTANLLIIKSILKLGQQPYFYIISLFIISYFYPSFFSHISADIGFFCHLYLLIAIIILCNTHKYKSKILFLLCVLLLCDVVTWRHQAILLLPLFLWYILKIYPQKKTYTHLRLCATSAALSLLIIVTINISYYHIFSIKRMHPEQVMMYSDIENINSMKKNLSFKHDFKELIGFYPYQTNNKEAKLYQNGYVGQCYGSDTTNEELYSLRTNKQYLPFIQSTWSEYALKYPKEFLISRAICYSQLLYAGAIPRPISALFEKYYPQTSIYSLNSFYDPNHDIYKTFVDLKNNGASLPHILLASKPFRHNLISTLIIPVYTIIYIWLILALPIMWLVRRNRQASHYDYVRLCVGTSIIYLIGFIPFTPTSDLRFSAPSIILGLLSFVMFITLRKHQPQEDSTDRPNVAKSL